MVFLRDVPAAEALERWLEVLGGRRLEAAEVPLEAALGRVTAAPVWARRSSPAYDASAMDGIAVRAADTLGATETSPRALPAHALVDTGDPLPEGYDAVVMSEHVHWEEGVPEVRAAAAPWQHVRTIGEDVSATELLLPEGHRLRAVDLAAAAAAGHVALSVRRAPRVVVIPTGDEVRPIGSAVAPGELIDTNGLMLVAQAREAGCEARAVPIVPDDPELILAAVRSAAEAGDLVVVIAGSSAGRDDHTAAVVERAGRLLVHGVAVRPGHPVVLGEAGGTPVLGAPGYPVSAALTFELFALPLLAALEGAAPVARPRATARLARRLASSMGADDWVRVRLGRVGGALVAAPLPRGAGVLTSLVRADGLLLVPAAREGHDAGEEVEVRLLRDLDAVERTIVCIGSHDPVLDLAASMLRARDPLLTLVSGPVGSLGGLVALREGLCHVAGLPPARPDGARVHPALDRARDAGAGGRRHPPRAPRAGPHRRAGEPARPARARGPRAGAVRQPAARGGNESAARPPAWGGRARAGRDRRLHTRGADPPRGRRGGGGGPGGCGAGRDVGGAGVRARVRAGGAGAVRSGHGAGGAGRGAVAGVAG